MTFLAQGISRYNISKNKVMNISISLPKYEEQVVIGTYFKNLNILIDQHHKQLIKLSNLKKGLLTKIFT
jgi:type I restriction enzyme S subunit